VALGATQALAQAGGDMPSAVPPRIDYDMASIADDRRPAGGNLTGVPASQPADTAAFSPASDEGAMTVLGVTLNGHELRGDTIVTVRDGRALVPVEDLKRWRLRFSGQTVSIDDQAFASLADVPGLRYRIDKGEQQLQLTAPVDSFETSTISGEQARLPPSEAARTAFLNYDLSLEHAAGGTIAQGFFTMGASDRHGLIENVMAVGNVPVGHKVLRLDTFAIHDDPSGPTRLTLGDTLTHLASWQQPVRFGGIKWGTDFTLQPGFLSFPTPTFNGQAQLPSSVQLYVNSVLNYQGQVDQGPFTLNRLPVVSGAGDVSVVVKDMLGVERRVVTSYYVSTNLLRPGLADFSIEAGAERRHYGLESFDYGPGFIAGSYRRGITSNLTLEARGEASSIVQDAGAGFAAVIGQIGEAGLSGSVSNGRAGSGYLYRVYAARISQHWSFSASYQYNSSAYRQLGLERNEQRPRETLQVSGGANDRRLGSLTANLSYLRLDDGTRARVSSITYGKQFGKLGYFNAFVLRSQADSARPNTTAGVSFSIAWGSRGTAFVQVDGDNRRVEAQLNRPDDKGWGYRFVASQGKAEQQQAELDYRGRAIDLTANVERLNGQTDERLLASGSLLWSGSSVMPSRQLDSSFAIVDVGNGEKGVRVYQENRLVGTTNKAGIAVVTNLRPYEANRISVAPSDFGLESMISNDNLLVVPRYLSGVKANFHVTNGHAGTVIVHLPNGDPLEPGTPVTIGDATFYTGFDGELFIDDIIAGKVMLARRAAGACSVTLPDVPKGVELPRIGPLTCHPAEPTQ
jgi:outer membrane usher protein